MRSIVPGGSDYHKEENIKDMSFIYYCPYCDQKIECENEDNGTKAPCPACRKVITVRRSAESSQREFASSRLNTAGGSVSAVSGNSKFSEYVSPVHKRPLLAMISMVFAAFHCLGALISFLLFLFFIMTGKGIAAILSAAGAMFVSLYIALIRWGIAQLISFIGKLSTNSEAIRKLLEMNFLPRN